MPLDFDTEYVGSVDCFVLGSKDIFSNILSVHVLRISFHLFVSSSVSIISILQFSKYMSFTSLVKFILRYFILFDVIENEIVFLISLFSSLLLVYRNITDYSVLILYPV